jgi:hypothetical protein
MGQAHRLRYDPALSLDNRPACVCVMGHHEMQVHHHTRYTTEPTRLLPPGTLCRVAGKLPHFWCTRRRLFTKAAMARTEPPMKSSTPIFRPWSTSSFGNDIEICSLDLMALELHLGLCRPPQGTMFVMRCVAHSVHEFFVARFVTTLVIAAVIVGLITWVL